MAWLTLNNDQKILQVVNHLISEGTEIKIPMKEEKCVFHSKLIKVKQENPLSEQGEEPQLIIEKLSPEKGNILIQSLDQVTVEFFIKDSLCRCNLAYIGISTHPYIGFIVSFPESIIIEEKRREERFTYDTPELISVEFSLGKKSKKDKQYELNVLDCSEYGLGMIITQRDFDLLELLHKGDKLEDITFFATWAMIKVNGTVRHITKLEDGAYKGCYLLGIESPNVIGSCRPNIHKG
jgi:hypothetical protein